MNDRRFSLLLMVNVAMIWFAIQAGEGRADEQLVREQLSQSRQRYATAEKWAKRREQLRREFLKGARLWPLPERPPIRAIIHSRREHRGYSVENVALETLPGFFCTGNLYRPLGRKALSPGILSPHGHFRPLGRFRESQQIRCAHLARMGATVFSYSMVGWQDSRQTTHDDPLVLALQTWNSVRAVDFLAGLERVDPDRIGVTGASGGGTQTFFLALVDDRIKASAPLVIVYPWSAPQGCRCEGGMPVMQAARTNAIELAAATAPRPQLLISVGNDPTRDFPKVGFPFIKHMYGVAGAEHFVGNLHLADEAHDFGPSKRKAVYEFFAKHLLLARDSFLAGDANRVTVLSEDTKTIKIEPPDQLAVFNDKQPLPADSLRGDKAIARTFEQHLATLRKNGRPTPRLDSGKTLSLQSAPRAKYGFKAAGPADEALLFTPPGFAGVGEAKVASGNDTGQLHILIRDGETGKLTRCRANVVGSDGNYYQPRTNELKEHSLTGVWPKSGWGNRQGKAPVRYLGRYFYCNGNVAVRVPAGTVRIEAWRGFEYRPTSITMQVSPGTTRNVELVLEKSAAMTGLGYWSGDPHIHIQRRDQADEKRILDLMEAEDIHFGAILAYNEPAGPYAGFMKEMESPQFRSLGKRSLLSRGDYTIVSGQEYRGSTYGHMNLFLLDDLVMSGQANNANDWPLYGNIARDARNSGGVSFYAHGGYAQAIYADVVQGNIDGVELLQFGVYRGIGLIDWYHMLNCGLRVPASGACDYPACRKLGDCKTYVFDRPAAAQTNRTRHRRPTMAAWLQGMKAGRSFFTSGPLLLLDVDSQPPGARLSKSGKGPHRITARIRVRSEVAPITHVQLIANGRILREMKVPPSSGQGNWLHLEEEVVLDRSAWIAARAFSLSSLGTPDAESHTNPVYVYINDRAPYDRASLDALVEALDKQIEGHKKRKFREKAEVIAYFERSRDILMKIREAGGAPATGHPSDMANADTRPLDTSRRTHTDEELKAFLKPEPPKPIEAVLKSFEAVDGFEMQLVAREPLVYDPTAAAFDERGNLFVCEMRDYPYKPAEGEKPIGTLRLLRDTDGDGVFDESHVFAENLLWAGGVAPWKGGVFVAAAPDIWYLKDTDGDYRADIRRKIYTGFGTQNQQGMLNNLQWGLDHKIYGSTSVNGGSIRHVSKQGRVSNQPIELGRRDFRFDPVTEKFEAIAGTVQFGTTFDDWGNRFLCSESAPLYHAILPEHYLARNPHLPAPRALKHIAPQPLPIFRISPIERWRQIRSSRRIAHGERDAKSAGASHHVIDAAAGITVYRGGAYPKKYYGGVFIGDGQNNLIHHRRLTPDGVTFRSDRVEQNTEFVRSSDIWFRPVNFLNAPDGTLYCLDMSREVLEAIHIPLDVVKHLNLSSGRKLGRIYRIAPPNFQFPGPPQFDKATTGELVAALESPHGWRRETAHRGIYERQDKAAVPALRRLLANSKLPQARLHALWSLEGLGELANADVARALNDAHFGVREHAMRLSEARLDDSPDLLSAIIRHSQDESVRIRFQAAFSLGASEDPRAAAALARLARSSTDAWLRTAILSSAGRLSDHMFVELVNDSGLIKTSNGVRLLEQLATVVGSQNNQTAVQRVLRALAAVSPADKPSALVERLVLAVGNGKKRNGDRLTWDKDASDREVSKFLQRLFNESRKSANDRSANEARRQAAIRLLGCGPLSFASETLSDLIDVRQPESLQLAAVAALADYAEPQIGAMLLRDWKDHAPAVRIAVVESLLARPERTRQFLAAAERGEVSAAQVDMGRRALLLKDPDTRTRSLASAVFGEHTVGSRGEALKSYQDALQLAAEKSRGEIVFKRDCMACHKVAGVGHVIGPDLTSSASRDALSLLTHVMDPNRYLLPKYETYRLVDTNGRVFTGMIAAQTATSVTLKREESKADTILRGNIDELLGTGKSLMPEGFEKKISKQEMADLIAYLQTLRPPTGKPHLDIGTLPGLIEPAPK